MSHIDRSPAPSAGDLLLQKIDAWADHAFACRLEECPTCDVLLNQWRVAYAAWRNSRHQAVTPPANSRALAAAEVEQLGIRHTVMHAIALLRWWAEDATDEPEILEQIRQSRECAGELERALATTEGHGV